MGIGVSVFLLAVGAILTFAVEFELQGIDIGVVGVILMIVGAIGLLLSVLFLRRTAPSRRAYGRRVVTQEEVL